VLHFIDRLSPPWYRINVKCRLADVNNFVDNRCRISYIRRMAKTKHIGVRLSPAASDALTRAAARDDRAVAALARKIIEEWLRANGGLKEKDDK
jgi:hypothetical protein